MGLNETNSQQLNGNPEQQWYIKAGKTKIQLVDTTWCMDAGLKGESYLVLPGCETYI